MDLTARATGVSMINRGKRKGTTKQTPTKDQSATTYKPARSDTARQNHKAIQRKVTEQ